MNSEHNDTIAAISTPAGVGGIAILRLSGRNAIKVVEKIWDGKSVDTFKTHSAHLGRIKDKEGNIIDEVVLTIFKGPNSFTGEDVIEISCHGSLFIQRAILRLLIDSGARVANAGEFTQRAFLNGKIDLMQAEAIADLIASNSQKAHEIAIKQTRGEYSSKIEALREGLINLASLLELELDFSEEDVEFAERTELLNNTSNLKNEIDSLVKSYSFGSVIKIGIPVTIAGIPNAGKSTLLNKLLSDNKAIVSDIPGTTRDVIEDTIEIDGILYRFFDTAGIHETSDSIEKLGIERTLLSIEKSSIIIWILDPTANIKGQLESFKAINKDKDTIVAVNKTDITEDVEGIKAELEQLELKDAKIVEISAKEDINICKLTQTLREIVNEKFHSEEEILLTNARHYDGLKKASESLEKTIEGIKNGISADFIAQDLREALYYVGSLTGKITNDTILQNIFSKFCIGK